MAKPMAEQPMTPDQVATLIHYGKADVKSVEPAGPFWHGISIVGAVQPAADTAAGAKKPEPIGVEGVVAVVVTAADDTQACLVGVPGRREYRIRLASVDLECTVALYVNGEFIGVYHLFVGDGGKLSVITERVFEYDPALAADPTYGSIVAVWYKRDFGPPGAAGATKAVIRDKKVLKFYQASDADLHPPFYASIRMGAVAALPPLVYAPLHAAPAPLPAKCRLVLPPAPGPAAASRAPIKRVLYEKQCRIAEFNELRGFAEGWGDLEVAIFRARSSGPGSGSHKRTAVRADGTVETDFGLWAERDHNNKRLEEEVPYYLRISNVSEAPIPFTVYIGGTCVTEAVVEPGQEMNVGDKDSTYELVLKDDLFAAPSTDVDADTNAVVVTYTVRGEQHVQAVRLAIARDIAQRDASGRLRSVLAPPLQVPAAAGASASGGASSSSVSDA